MQEEIFGPLLPLKTYASDPNEAIHHINSGPRPLAAYFFGDNQAHQHQMARQTISGALVINDVMIEQSAIWWYRRVGNGRLSWYSRFLSLQPCEAVVIQNQEGTINLR